MNIIGFFIAFFEWLDIAIYTIFPNSIIQDTIKITSKYNHIIFFSILSILTLSKILGAYFIESFNKDRTKTLFISNSVISLTSLSLALLPKYNKIGILSFVLLIILTIIKGIAMGGNYNATIISANSKTNRYVASSLISVGIFCGFLLIEIIKNSYETIIKQLIYICFKHTNTLKKIYCNFASTSFSLWQILFIISAIYSFLANLTIFLCTKNYKKTLKSIQYITFLFNILMIISALTDIFLLKNLNIFFYIITSIICPLNFMLLIIKMQIKTKERLEENNTIHNIENITVSNYLKIITLTLIEALPFYCFFLLIPNYYAIQYSLTIKILIIVFIPMFAYLSDLGYALSILKLSCYLIIISPILIIFQNDYLTALAASLFFSSCYGVLYGYLPIILKKQNKESALGLSINLSQGILHFIIPILSLLLQNNEILLIYILIILCSIIGMISLKIVKDYDV